MKVMLSTYKLAVFCCECSQSLAQVRVGTAGRAGSSSCPLQIQELGKAKRLSLRWHDVQAAHCRSGACERESAEQVTKGCLGGLARPLRNLPADSRLDWG